MTRIIFMMVIGVLVCAGSVFADKIYLKSGKVLEGKLREKKELMPWDDWCTGEDQVELWHNHSGQCLNRSEIVKIEKEYKKPEGVALLAKDDHWGEESDGYRTQLIPASDEYVIGRPMLFHLLMQNVSDEVKWYDDQGLAHPPFNIIGPDGEKIIHKVGPFQTLGAEEPIDTDEIVVLMENRDITEEYVITKPGIYRIEFPYGWASSNVVEFEVKPGQLKKEDVLITSLSDVIPDKCYLYKGWKISPAGRQEIKAVPLAIYCGKIHHMGGEMLLWQSDKTVDISVDKENENIEVSEYLGKNDSGHIYVSSSEKLRGIWPNIKEDIIKALKLKK